MKSKHYLHGGDLDAVSIKHNIDRNSIWDFSGNINPLGISPKTREALKENIDLIATYPDRNYTKLKEVISTYAQVDSNHIIVGNGSTELIAMTIKCIKPQKALVLGPTYSEYEREINLLGGLCDYYPLQESNDFRLDTEDFIASLSVDYDLLIICNPNNPTGTGISADHLKRILEITQKLHIFTMIDETYVEFCDDPGVYSAVPLTLIFDHLLVLRGISKFFAAPGLRFGYGISSNAPLKATLLKLQNPWSINSLADFAVQMMLTDQTYISDTHRLFVSERKRIVNELSAVKELHLFEPAANFVLIKILTESISSDYLLHELLKDHILIRDASSFPFLSDGYIRFCFLNPEQNDILISKLKTLIKNRG
ncbi:pyridoxal phosphate-dependent aminotransferase [Cellulosilyticum sp. I15G10I2]|uniref:pyridoxal phosphate-dependent aminotransferase n=1 Tax=Cellulosilyticum sp. I15G10I2 TaxID=1892843 RepID=UPI00085C07CF|nr:histidinol-phosphate transaminase [Cellulosilyticum sp. I15G10I2]